MKVNLKGLLLMARRHLVILEECIDCAPEGHDYELEVENPSLILDELIDYVTSVQEDNSLLGQFANLYCLTKDGKEVEPNETRVDAIWEQAVKDVQEQYDELLKEKTMKPTEAINTSYIPQPAPIPRTSSSIHDLVLLDLNATEHLLAEEIKARKDIGLERYGTPLQAFNGRDCETDAIEEIVDSICYLKQGIFEGKPYLEYLYRRAITLAVDAINLRRNHKEKNTD